MITATRFLASMALLATAGCGATETPDDGQRIVAAALKTLTSGGKSICVDSRTRGEALIIFRTMRVAPAPVRRPLAWRVPSGLTPPPGLTNSELFNDQIRREPVYLQQQKPATIGELPLEMQGRLDTAANALSVTVDGVPEDVAEVATPRVTPRWWVFNRFASDCRPAYTLSHPVWREQVGFITITADHWGKTYAFAKRQGEWQTIAEWAGWLY